LPLILEYTQFIFSLSEVVLTMRLQIMNNSMPFKKPPGKTVALIARIYIGELPYIIAWINYYTKLGISKIYLIITNKDESQQIKQYLQNINDRSNIIHFIVSNINTINLQTYDSVISLIKEDYTLCVDIDEYLDIAPHKNICTLVTNEPCEKYHFYWLISTCDGISNSTKGFHCRFSKKPFKTMCKTDLIAGWKDSHDFFTKVPVKPTFTKYSLVHFFGRTFNDMLIKSFYGKGYANKHKHTSEEELEQTVNSANISAIPTRLKMMALISRVRKSVNINPSILNELQFDINLEMALLDMLTEQNKTNIYAKYTIFRNNLDYQTQIKQYFEKGLSGVKWDDL